MFGYVGCFSYNGGYDQKLLMDFGLGCVDVEVFNNDFDCQFVNVLGLCDFGQLFGICYFVFELVGGMIVMLVVYGQFLCCFICGEYQFGKMFGQYVVCIELGMCLIVVSILVVLLWYYVFNYWIEDQFGGDGVFSFVGVFGFYLWIIVDKQYYGMFVCEILVFWVYVCSVVCGVLICCVFVEGKLQYVVEGVSSVDFVD